MHLLLTGFEPFAGSPVNPSALIAKLLAENPPPGVTIIPAILPVERVRGPRALLDAFDAAWPDAVLCLGQAARRPCLSIERVAVNLLDYGIPDNAGHSAQDLPVIPDSPAAYFSTLPVRRLFSAVQAAGIPVELSLSAGAYLCNQIFYTLMHALSTKGLIIPAGFVHVPALPEQAAASPGAPMPSMSLDTMLAGVRIIIQEIGRVE